MQSACFTVAVLHFFIIRDVARHSQLCADLYQPGLGKNLRRLFLYHHQPAQFRCQRFGRCGKQGSCCIKTCRRRSRAYRWLSGLKPQSQKRYFAGVKKIVRKAFQRSAKSAGGACRPGVRPHWRNLPKDGYDLLRPRAERRSFARRKDSHQIR